jgi:hypothetical protein
MIEFKRAAGKFSGARGIHLQMENRMRSHPKDIAVVFPKFDGARNEPQPFFRFRFGFLRPALADKMCVAVGRQRHRGGIARIDGERLFEMAQGGDRAFRGEFVRKVLGAQEQIISIEVRCRFVLRPLDFGELEPRFDGGDDARGKSVLKIEDIAHRAFEPIGPHMRAGRAVDELSGEAQAIAGAADAAFEHVADTKFAPDLSDINRPALILKEEFRAMTNSQAQRDRAVMISSAMPSAK